MTPLRQTGLTVFLGLVCVAGGVLAWRQHLELVSLRHGGGSSDDAALRRQLAAAQARLRGLEDELAASRTGAAPTTEGDAPAGNPARVAGGPPGRGFGPGGPGGRGGRGPDIRAVLDDPAAQRLMQQQQRLALDGRYAALFRNLNLPADKLEKFKTLLLDKQTATQDVFAAAEAQGLDPRTNRDEIRKLVASTQGEIDDSLKSLLGADGFAQYEKFQQTQPQRNLVNQLQQSLSYTATPLTTTQAEQLVDVFATTTATSPSGNPRGGGEFGRPPPPDGGGRGFGGGPGGPGGPGGGPQPSATLTPAAMTAAQQVLSTAQVEALVQIQQTQQAQQQLGQMMRANRGGDAAPKRGG